MKQQTAVEFFEEKLVNMYINTDKIHPIKILEFIKQAKQMEREQIIKAYNEGYDNGYIDNGIDGEKYYEEIFIK